MNYIKKLFNAFIMAFTMYTSIPTKFNIWDKEVFHLILPFLPIIGGIIGVIWFFISKLLFYLDLPFMLEVTIIMLTPLFLSGFIHIDGYMDTCDAIFSRSSLEKKRLILKDPNVGAFAVVSIIILFFINFSCVYEILKKSTNIIAFIFIPIISRAITVIMALKTKSISVDGFISNFKRGTNNFHLGFLFFLILSILILSYIFLDKDLFIILIFTLIFGILFSKYCINQLDGISGDLCGFIITLSETFTLIFWTIIL